MEITAKNREIIDWDAEQGKVIVANLGDTVEVSEAFAKVHRDAWCDDLSQLDHDGDGEPGGSTAAEGDKEDLAALRKHYEEVLGKRPFPGWDADELNRRIADAQDDGEEDPAEAPID